MVKRGSAAVDKPHVLSSRTPDRIPVDLNLISRSLAFHRKQLTPRAQQRQTPAGEPIEWGDRPGGHPVCRTYSLPDRRILHAAADHPDRVIEPEACNRLVKKVGPAP
jgi:hypothetical protein